MTPAAPRCLSPWAGLDSNQRPWDQKRVPCVSAEFGLAEDRLQTRRSEGYEGIRFGVVLWGLWPQRGPNALTPEAPSPPIWSTRSTATEPPPKSPA